MLVTGTGTGTGKTWVAAQALGALRAAGNVVAARKPVQSYEPGVAPTDADVLATATGERPTDVCPRHRWYEVPMAPPMAAEALGRPGFGMAHILDELRWPPDVHYGLVEGVGGPRSPLADDGDTATLAAALRPDTAVLVAGPELGCINAVLLAVAALGPQRALVFLNCYREDDPLHARNAEWLRSRCGLDVVTGVGALVQRLAGGARAPGSGR